MFLKGGEEYETFFYIYVYTQVHMLLWCMKVRVY